MTQTGFDSHDHSRCIHSAIDAAEARCAEEKLRLTPVRKRVLEILLEDHRAQGAYDILARLTEEGHGAQPPIAYRALDFLVSHGFAHRIEQLNAYVACTHAHSADHAPAFLICRACSSVVEAGAQKVEATIGTEAKRLGFQIERTVLEIEGVCPRCIETDSQ